MKLDIKRDIFYPPLKQLSGIVERKHRLNLPILSHFLISFQQDLFSVTASDTELEMKVSIGHEVPEAVEFTLPARKIIDICQSLSSGVKLELEIAENKTLIRSGRSRFTLVNLPVKEYPRMNLSEPEFSISVRRDALRALILNTRFAIAQHDVRHALNGLLLEIESNTLRAVATDGHRLALDELSLSTGLDTKRQIIVPKKGVLELVKLLAEGEEDQEIELRVNNHLLQIEVDNVLFISKLIDMKFPEYSRVIPEIGGSGIRVDSEKFEESLRRASILSNEKLKGIRLTITGDTLRTNAHNTEQEEAEEEIDIQQYQGSDLEIGFNASYLLDILSVIKTKDLLVHVSDPKSSCLFTPDGEGNCKYVVMPMRL